jgi:hypothetical protein
LKAKRGDFDHSEGVILENTPDITRIREGLTQLVDVVE